MAKNNGKSLFCNRTLSWTKPSLSKRAIISIKTGYFESNEEHAPGGLYGNSGTAQLSRIRSENFKKPIMYNIYKYTTNNNILNINIIDKYIVYK